jgi:epoxyqueuosine reductase QueG
MLSIESLECALMERGAAFVACADLRALSPECREGLPCGVTIGVALRPTVVDRMMRGACAEYDAEFERTSALRQELRQKCLELLRSMGAKAIRVPPALAQADDSTLMAPLPDKTVATLAGVGWIGKCALLVTEAYGCALRLVTVLTDAELPTGMLVTISRCGDCRVCVDACPAHAPSGVPWRPGIPRDEFFDAFACQQHGMRMKAANNLRHEGCGICVAVCPWTQEYARGESRDT